MLANHITQLLHFMVQTIDTRIAQIESVLAERAYQLFDYQREGVRWMLEQELTNTEFCYGGILADDPGLGKTIQTISLIIGNPPNPLLTTPDAPNKTLIVVPISIIQQWKDAIEAIYPSLQVTIHHSSYKEYIFAQDIEKDKCNIVITGYHQLYASINKEYWQTVLHKHRWYRVILDEGHLIRNHNTKLFKGAFDIPAKYRWILSGTPIQNKIDDIISMFKYLHVPPTLINHNLDRLKSTKIFRRNRSIVADRYKELFVKIVDMPFDSNEERDFYIRVKDEVHNEFLRVMRECEDEKDKMMIILELILRLRQASIHPNLVIRGLAKKYGVKKPKLWRHGSSTKIQKLRELIDCQNRDDKAMVVCHFKEEMELISADLQRAFPKLRVKQFNGSMSTDAKNDVIRMCCEDGVDVLLINIVCGGVGLNLQMFNKVYILTPNWNPSNEIQAIARCHRIGQTRNVDVFKLVLQEPEFLTIDQRILDIQRGKRELMAKFLSDNTLLFSEDYTNNNVGNMGKLTMRDFRKLLC